MNNSLTLEHISVSEMDNNCYLLCSGSHGLLIDAADSPEDIMAMAQRAGVAIEIVLTTHRHWDHVRALPEILEKTGAKHYTSFLDSPAMPARVDVELEQGDVIDFDGHSLDVMILRGHTPGGVGLAAEIEGTTNLFVGDSLFPGGVGKTTSEGDFGRLFKDVSERIFEVYADDTVVHPGHGDPTTLGKERPHLQEWLERRW